MPLLPIRPLRYHFRAMPIFSPLLFCRHCCCLLPHFADMLTLYLMLMLAAIMPPLFFAAAAMPPRYFAMIHKALSLRCRYARYATLLMLLLLSFAAADYAHFR